MSGQPNILCCLVARASVVLARYIDPQVGANLEDTINQLLANVSPEQESATLKFSGFGLKLFFLFIDMMYFET